MPLNNVPHTTLEPLIRRHLSTTEDETTSALILRLQPARDRGSLTRAELLAICDWKSPRAIRHIRANNPEQVRRATKRALDTRSERRRLRALLSLKGVSVPTASAILTLLNPRRYGVIDIRVWQLLHKMGAVTGAPSGVGFTFDHWYQFLMIVRDFAKRYGVRARDIERALFLAHRHYQSGRLYDRLTRGGGGNGNDDAVSSPRQPDDRGQPLRHARDARGRSMPAPLPSRGR
jgi:hypothetical protein